MNSSFQNTQENQNKLRKLKVEFVLNSNRGKNEETIKAVFYRTYLQ